MADSTKQQPKAEPEPRPLRDAVSQLEGAIDAGSGVDEAIDQLEEAVAGKQEKVEALHEEVLAQVSDDKTEKNEPPAKAEKKSAPSIIRYPNTHPGE